MFGDSDKFRASVVRYGFGASYELTPESDFQFTPVVEPVGWTVTGGYGTGSIDGTVATLFIEDAGGTNVMNLKIGARMGSVGSQGSVYAGWGTALTNSVWYSDIIRLEYRYVF